MKAVVCISSRSQFFKRGEVYQVEDNKVLDCDDDPHILRKHGIANVYCVEGAYFEEVKDNG